MRPVSYPNRLWRVAARFAATLPLVVLIAGCGPGAGSGTKNASLTVSHDFGSVVVTTATQSKVPGAESVMSLLQRYTKVGTAYGGGFVQSIDGAADDESNHIAWFYYVNGSLAGKGAELTSIHADDRVWWDLHDWRASEGVPAVVGSYPAPFDHGVSGTSATTVIACGSGVASACAKVSNQLVKVGVKPEITALTSAPVGGAIVIDVGTWAQVRRVSSGQTIAAGPVGSGVYARPAGVASGATSGTELELLTPAGKVARRLAGQWGLIAATQSFSVATPTWVVTGDTAASVVLAAEHFERADLDGRFAVAVDSGTVVALPVDAAQ